jgi:hypothetical protein
MGDSSMEKEVHGAAKSARRRTNAPCPELHERVYWATS